MPDFAVGEAIEGVAYVGNAGREKATVLESELAALWLKSPPNMYFPHHLREQAVMNCLKTAEFAPGEVERLAIAVPKREDPECDLYISGRIVYEDRLHTHRTNLFCRRYDPAKQRFIPVCDPDIEAEY